MLSENRIPTHPGEILLEDFLLPFGITQVAFAKHISVPARRIHEIVLGQRSITPEMAWLLAQAFGTSPELSLGGCVRSRPCSTHLSELLSEAQKCCIAQHAKMVYDSDSP